MKQYIVAAFFSITVILLSMNIDNAVNVFDEPQVIDQVSIDEMKKEIGKHLTAHDFNSIIQILPDNLVFGLCDKTGEYDRWISVKAYGLIMLGRKNEASELMGKAVLQQMHKDELAMLFFQKAGIDCLNDNYGNATISMTKAIEWSEKSTEVSEAEKFTFTCYLIPQTVWIGLQRVRDLAWTWKAFDTDSQNNQKDVQNNKARSTRLPWAVMCSLGQRRRSRQGALRPATGALRPATGALRPATGRPTCPRPSTERCIANGMLSSHKIHPSHLIIR